MKRYLRDALIGVIALGLAIPVVAFADRRGPPHGPPPGAGMLVRLLEENQERLGLQDSVFAEIRALADAERKAVDALVERKRSAHEAMRALLDAPVPDEGRVMAQADVLGEIDIQLHKERLRTLIGIRKLLTTEQLAELNKIHEERRPRRGEGPPDWHRRGGGPPPPPF